MSADPPAPALLTGLFGKDIAESRSPFLHEREAEAQGISLVYRLYDFAALGLEVDDLPRMLGWAVETGFAGINVTYPFKQAIIPLLDELSENAARVGAVNTVAFRDGRLFGENTDSLGFAEGVRRGLDGASLEAVVQLGAGGGGAAVAHALLDAGTQALTLFDPEADRVAGLVESLARLYPGRRIAVGLDLEREVARAHGLVNATPIGMSAHPGSPLPLDLLRPALWVADIVYFPLETELLRAAHALGCRTMDGSGMVVFQAAAAFDVFTGLSADRERMLRSFFELAKA
jgi:shikimate dehydrogenase